MSQENVEIVMAAYGVVQHRDFASPFDLADEEIVWDMSGFELPDMARLYRGHDGLREFWRDWLQAWERVEFKRLVPEDHGDHVIVEVNQRNRGRGSGVDIDFHYFQTFAVRDGKITASRMASTKAEALEAVGLSE
jgi:ketosteroid isomerase-like protein